MLEEQNGATMSRLLVDLFVKGDLGVADELVTPDFIEHSAAPGLPAGIPGLKAIAQVMRAAFPDYNLIIDDVVTKGDRVALRLTAEGTQTGEVFGIPATGNHAIWSEMHIMRVNGGKMVEHWDVIDLMGMMRQLGVLQTH